MTIKHIFIAVILALLALCAVQVFSVPPYAGDIFSVYKSGYFRELDRGFSVIADAFVETKMLTKPVHAWILLEDMESKHGLDIKVYNRDCLQVLAPGKTGDAGGDDVRRILDSINPGVHSEVRGGRYYAALPVFLEERCGFCHESGRPGELAGVISFERDYDAGIYYSSERTVIFCALSAALLVLLFFAVRWDPGKKVKELFDKS